MAAKTVRASSMKRSISRVCVKGFQFTRSPGSAAAAGGMARLDHQPSTATPSTATATRPGPASPITSSPPTMVPARMATKVAASTSALPPTSSSSASCCGMIAYLTGPNSADCVPIRNSTTSSSGSDIRANPTTASAITAISSSLVARIRRLFSYLSASWPAVAENRKKGRMKMPAARFTSTAGESAPRRAAWKVISTTSAFL